jgi:hypothetical protein
VNSLLDANDVVFVAYTSSDVWEFDPDDQVDIEPPIETLLNVDPDSGPSIWALEFSASIKYKNIVNILFFMMLFILK